MFRGKWKFLPGIIVLVMIAGAVYIFYLYQQGGTAYYNPPVQKTDDPKDQQPDYIRTMEQRLPINLKPGDSISCGVWKKEKGGLLT